jgi:hypothetical protein
VAGVLPRLAVVGGRLGVVAREQPVEVLGVDEVLAQDRRGVGVRDDVLAEVQLVVEDVPDDPAEEGDVAADADRGRAGQRPPTCG